MNKRGILLWIVLGLFVLVSCTDKTVTNASKVVQAKSIELKHVNFMGQWKNEGKREDIIRDFVREYEFLNQDVLVNLKFPEEIGFDRYNTLSTCEYIEKVLNQDKPEWDIILINDDVEGIANKLGNKNWASKYLVDFSQYSELAQNTIPEIDLEKVKRKWGGIIPGPFLEGQYWALWTNKNVVKKLGIEVKQYGMTYEDFLSYIKGVSNYNENHADKIIPFYEASDWRTAFSIAINLYLSLIGDDYMNISESFEAHKLEAWRQTLNALEELSKYNPINADWQKSAWAKTKTGLLNEECLFFSNGSWMYNIWLQENSEKVMNCVPNEFPIFEKSASIYPSGYPIMWGVPKNAPNKEQAIKMLLAMSKPAMAENWVRNTKCPTGIKGNLASTSFGFDQYEDFSYYIQNKYGSNQYKMQETSKYIFGEKFMYERNYFMEVLTGEISTDEAMEKIHQQIAKL